jgi:hypothetical protein
MSPTASQSFETMVRDNDEAEEFPVYWYLRIVFLKSCPHSVSSILLIDLNNEHDWALSCTSHPNHEIWLASVASKSIRLILRHEINKIGILACLIIERFIE